MALGLPSWPRPRFEPGGGDAFLFFAIYGEFSNDIQVSGKQYRTAGTPQGIDIRKLNQTQSPEFPFTSGPIEQLLQPKNPALFAQIQDVPECLIIQGTIPDPPDLNYLRDTIGLVTSFLDNGGIAIIDPQQFALYNPTTWHEEIFEPQPPRLSKHAVILFSDEPDGTRWYHTRGLRKFGRPDLSMHGVRTDDESAVIEMFNRFILLQAEGHRILEGQEIRMASLPAGLTCHHAGTVDDPDFNNVHVEIK